MTTRQMIASRQTIATLADPTWVTLASLSKLPLWVAWKEELHQGTPKKMPYNPRSGAWAKSDNPATWSDREKARSRAKKLRVEGSEGGHDKMLRLGDGLAIDGVDLDSCIDLLDSVEPWAAEILERFGTYAEVSPGLKGLKVFFTYDPADLPALRAAMGRDWSKTFSRGEHCEIALHLGGRYFTVTDSHHATTPADLRPVALADLVWLIEEAGPSFIADAEEDQVDRSAVMFGILTAALRDEKTFVEAKAAVMADAHASAHVADQGRSEASQDKYLTRQWKRAKAANDSRDAAQAADIGAWLAELSDLSEDQSAQTAVERDWTITAFDQSGEPVNKH